VISTGKSFSLESVGLVGSARAKYRFVAPHSHTLDVIGLARVVAAHHLQGDLVGDVEVPFFMSTARVVRLRDGNQQYLQVTTRMQAPDLGDVMTQHGPELKMAKSYGNNMHA
jgi:hypothetical protein